MKGEQKNIMECLKIIEEIKQNIPDRNIENAIKIAKRLIKALEIKTYPIPIVKILNDIHFSVFASEMPENISGFLIIGADLKDKFKTDKVIAIDQKDTPGRQRFTLAHEFGHYLFDFNENEELTFCSTFNIDAAETDEEKIPSRFAAEFLMPEDIFRKRYNELSALTKYERLNQLVEDFDVTATSATRRFDELGLK